MAKRCPMFLLLLCASLNHGLAAELSEGTIDFNGDVLPILSDNCFHCHGPDEAHREAKLRLDTAEGLFSATEKHAIVVPSASAESELIRRITAPDPADRMPPPESKRELTAAQIETLRSWIDGGAPWEDHWAFLPPRRPALPQAGKGSWARNEIDLFILSRLQKLGLKPSPETDRRTLIRRLSYDLRGLPPSPDEVESFVADPHPNAYEQLVDRMLASERYGERMALAWMDAARYGDSSVFHADGVRTMWPWRDWVIRAFNSNMPFDQFTVEQLAGDLLPNATIQQKVASGFNRNHGTTDEGGAIDEEYRVEYVVDRVKTTATVWLGLTMECAQCHDHKYDPVSQKEYYQFYAYFNQTKDPGMQTRNGNAPPFVYVLSPDQEGTVAELRAATAGLQRERKESRPEEGLVNLWAQEQRETEDLNVPTLSEWRSLGPFTEDDANKVFETAYGPEQKAAPEESYEGKQWESRSGFQDAQVVALDLPARSGLYLHRTIEVAEEKTASVSLGSDDAIQVWLNGKELLSSNARRGAAADQEKVELPLAAGTNHFLMKIVNDGGGSGFYFRLAATDLPAEIVDILTVPEVDLNEEQRGKLAEYYRAEVWPAGLALDERIAKLQEEEKTILDSVPTSMVMEDMETPRKTHVLSRGHYASPIEDEDIQPGVPACLPALPENSPANRLGLARWLVQRENPLAARVTVNRFWQLLFGQGLVATAGDFGTRGDRPTHPQLLDWLAVDFVENGWDVKRLMKQLAMSATYRQSSRVQADHLEKDPGNRYYARAPRFRLQGEFIRDTALELAGLLVDTVGGPSVKPYQPPNIWNEVSLDGNLRYGQDTGRKLYRRSMYIYWKRSAPSPSMMAFDAPTREKCVVQRQRTNTPLQALVTMNDVQFVEAARLFARRIVEEAEPEPEARIRHAFKLATARPADALRLRVMKQLYDEQLEYFREEPERADELLQFGDLASPAAGEEALELAAWTMVASAILNLDEVLTKE